MIELRRKQQNRIAARRSRERRQQMWKIEDQVYEALFTQISVETYYITVHKPGISMKIADQVCNKLPFHKNSVKTKLIT